MIKLNLRQKIPFGLDCTTFGPRLFARESDESWFRSRRLAPNDWATGCERRRPLVSFGCVFVVRQVDWPIAVERESSRCSIDPWCLPNQSLAPTFEVPFRILATSSRWVDSSTNSKIVPRINIADCQS